MKRKLGVMLLALVMLASTITAFAAGRVDYKQYNPNKASHYDVKEFVEYKGYASTMWGRLGPVEGTPDQMCVQLASYETKNNLRVTYVPTDVFSEDRNYYLVSYDMWSTRLSCNVTVENLGSNVKPYNTLLNLIGIDGLKYPNPPTIEQED